MLGIVVLSIFCGMLLLLITGLIPRSMIEDSCRESSVYFQEHELFPYLVEGQFNTRQDNYADCILVNILYHIDGKDLSASLIKASYYNPEMETVEVSLTESMQAEQIPNVDYFRYWHGGMVLLRPLFVFTGIQGAAALSFMGMLFLCFAIVYLFRSKNFDGRTVVLCLLVGTVPYLRYAVLENHAYLHYFFTYRAQLVTVTMLLFVTYEFGLKNLRKNS